MIYVGSGHGGWDDNSGNWFPGVLSALSDASIPASAADFKNKNPNIIGLGNLK
jgi:hypothetical protein